jgi:tetratricopeptide (TPR) repeat protein
LTRLPVINRERREIVDSGRLTLGYIYFELGAYKKAIEYFSDVDNSHPEYPNALLGMAWSHVKMGNFRDAVVVLNKFLKKFPEDENAEEAHFVLGQSYLKIQDYDRAIAEFDFIVQRYPGPEQMAEVIASVRKSLITQKKRIEKLKVELLLLESKLLDTIPLNATNGASGFLKKERERLEKQRDELAKNIVAERKLFQSFTENFQAMERRLAQKEVRKQWRAYAEYGKTRALFLKSINQN